MKTIQLGEITVEVPDETFEALKKQLGLESKVWKPEYGEQYWCVSPHGIFSTWTWRGDKSNEFDLSIGNVFRTKEEAEEAIKTGWVARLQAETTIRNYIKDKGYDTAVDWENEQIKWLVMFDWVAKQLRVDYWSSRIYSGLTHFKNRTDAEDTMKACEKEYKVLFGIK